MGPFDLCLRPDPNARKPLSAVHITGKKALLVKYRSSVNAGSSSMGIVVPDMENSGPAQGPKGGSRSQKVAFARGVCGIS